MQEQDTTVSPVEYRVIAGHPKYRVGSDGTIWRVWRDGWKPRKFTTNRDGYKLVNFGLGKKGQKAFARVHRIVIEAFKGPCPQGYVCRHLDGNPSNNRIENLEWGTQAENYADSIRHGTARIGVTVRKYMSQAEKQLVRDEYAAGGVSQMVLAKRHGVGRRTVLTLLRRAGLT